MVAEANGNIFKGKEKVAQLQLYVQDILTGPSPSNVQVAAARSTSTSPTFFGLVAVIDDPVRTAPSPEAEIVGRAQGFFAFASLEEGGKYNGSTLNLVGRNPYPRDHRELSVVGGSGVFRLARGYVGVTTVSMNSANGDAFFQYNITVLHY
ncbi:dirigent protein 19 [Phtheirospermum japonicum]|uniref:Dirigent protein n=1 Tax=Phtheirospermum japonicum TaxID=374723 RepID=A0A830BYX9_9LAMI|nr:dirigent protein 19 [Phtheirospermum japonicum]